MMYHPYRKALIKQEVGQLQGRSDSIMRNVKLRTSMPKIHMQIAHSLRESVMEKDLGELGNHNPSNTAS